MPLALQRGCSPRHASLAAYRRQPRTALRRSSRRTAVTNETEALACYLIQYRVQCVDDALRAVVPDPLECAWEPVSQRYLRHRQLPFVIHLRDNCRNPAGAQPLNFPEQPLLHREFMVVIETTVPKRRQLRDDLLNLARMSRWLACRRGRAACRGHKW